MFSSDEGETLKTPAIVRAICLCYMFLSMYNTRISSLRHVPASCPLVYRLLAVNLPCQSPTPPLPLLCHPPQTDFRARPRWRWRSRTPRFPGFVRDKNTFKPPASRLTQLINRNFCVSLPHWSSRTLSLPTNPLNRYDATQTLYEQTPMRTTLLTWEFQDLDLIVLADESYHGKKAIDVMKQLDSDRCA